LLKKETKTQAIGIMTEEFNDLLNNKRFIQYVGLEEPYTPGIRECMLTVKHKHFNPQSQQSALFFMHTIRWAKKIWTVMSVPAECRDAVEKIAAECGLESTRGVPMQIKGDRWETFLPFTGRTFVFDNTPDHLIFRRDPFIEEILKNAEQMAIDKIIRT